MAPNTGCVGECSICLENLIPMCNSPVNNKTCNHGNDIYHRCCMDRWLINRKVCPLDNASWMEGIATPREKELISLVERAKTPAKYVKKLVMNPTITEEEWKFIAEVQLRHANNSVPSFIMKALSDRFAKPAIIK